MRYLLSLLALAVLVGCQSNPVNVDYDTRADFSTFNQYAWAEDACRTEPLMCDRVKSALTSGLAGRKMTYSKEQPDFLVRYWVRNATDEQDDRPRSSVGIGGGSGGVGMGVSLGIPLGAPKRKIEVVIEFVSPSDQHLQWQGIRKDGISAKGKPDEITAEVARIVGEILSQFPPGKK